MLFSDGPMAPAHGICERWKFINVIKRKLNSDFPSSNLRPLKLKSDCERFATLPYWLLYIIIIIAECHQAHHVATHEHEDDSCLRCAWAYACLRPHFSFYYTIIFMYFIKVGVLEKPWICLLKKVLHEWHLSLDWIFLCRTRSYRYERDTTKALSLNI